MNSESGIMAKQSEFKGVGGFSGWVPQFNLERTDTVVWIRDGSRRIALFHPGIDQLELFEFFPGKPVYDRPVELPSVYHAPTLLGVKVQTCQWINWAQSRSSDRLDHVIASTHDQVTLEVREEWDAWKGRSLKRFRLRVDAEFGYMIDYENEMEGAAPVKLEFANLLAKGMADHRSGKVRFPYVVWKHPSLGALKWASNMVALRTYGQLDTYDKRKIARDGWISMLGESDWNPVLTIDEASQDVASVTCGCLLDEHVHFKGPPARNGSGGFMWRNKGCLFVVPGHASERLLAAAVPNDLDTRVPHPERTGVNWRAEYPFDLAMKRDPRLHALKLGEICDFETPINIHNVFRGQFFPADEQVEGWAKVTRERAHSGSQSLCLEVSRAVGSKTLGMCGSSLWVDGGVRYRLSLWLSYRGACPAALSVRATQIYFSMADPMESSETTIYAEGTNMPWRRVELTLVSRPNDPALVLEFIASGDGKWFMDDVELVRYSSSQEAPYDIA